MQHFFVSRYNKFAGKFGKTTMKRKIYVWKRQFEIYCIKRAFGGFPFFY